MTGQPVEEPRREEEPPPEPPEPPRRRRYPHGRAGALWCATPTQEDRR